MKHDLPTLVQCMLLITFVLVCTIAFDQQAEHPAAFAQGYKYKASVSEQQTYNEADSSHRKRTTTLIRATTLGESIGVDRIVLQARPNPARYKTDLAFKLRESCNFRLEVLNVKGNVLTVVAEGKGKAGDNFSFTFKTDKLAGGHYISRLVTDHEVTSVRFVVKD